MVLIKLLLEIFVLIIFVFVVGGLLMVLWNFLIVVGFFGLKLIEEMYFVIKGIFFMI